MKKSTAIQQAANSMPQHIDKIGFYKSFDALAGFGKYGELERDDSMSEFLRNTSLGSKRGKMIEYFEVVKFALVMFDVCCLIFDVVKLRG